MGFKSFRCSSRTITNVDHAPATFVVLDGLRCSRCQCQWQPASQPRPEMCWKELAGHCIAVHVEACSDGGRTGERGGEEKSRVKDEETNVNDGAMS